VPSTARKRRHSKASPVNESAVAAAVDLLSGTRRGSRRPSSSGDAESSSPRSLSIPRLRHARPDMDLAHLVDEMTHRLHQAKDLWKLQLTLAVCNPLTDIPIGTVPPISPTTRTSTVNSLDQLDEVCWNGHSKSR